METALLSHDQRQVSIDSCSNLVIDEQGSGGVSKGGGFPHHSSSNAPPAAPVDQQGFTPFVLASQTMEDASGDGQTSHDTNQIPPDPQTECGENDKKAESAKDKQTSNVQNISNKKKPQLKQKRRNYNYSSDDDDDVFLPNPPPKSQADRCTIAMETDEEKSTVVKEMEPQRCDSTPEDTTEEGALMIDNGDGGDTGDTGYTGDTGDGGDGGDTGEAGEGGEAGVSDGEFLNTTAETEGEMTATEEEDLGVVNNRRSLADENENPPATTLSPSAVNQGGLGDNVHYTYM